VVDGVELTNKKDDAAFQKVIGYVEQETFIAEGTLEENIAILEDEIDYNRLERAIIDAQLEDFVKNQPLGLKMQLGEAGIKLSGGQKQRVGIARALYKNPQILVLDEITSALDSATEKEIVKVINGLSGMGKTIIIVAHRKSTLDKADKIIQINNF
jgi:ABC-type bacteriocin/lantibiotic exporter with double-glycine peptidase domain